MLTVLLDIVAVELLALGSIVTTISVYGVLRMPDVYSQLHSAGMASPTTANYVSNNVGDQPIRAQIRAGALGPACGISWHIATKSGHATKCLGIANDMGGTQGSNTVGSNWAE